MTKWEYEVENGFFVQDEGNVDDDIEMPPHFGLKWSDEGRWETFQEAIDKLSEGAGDTLCYKVFFLGRHGQGYHNVAEAKYGTKDWDDYWSKLNGDGEIVWGPDPELTPTGISQADAINATWQAELSAGIPSPTKAYCSPLTRALHTYQVTFDRVALFGKRDDLHPLVLEDCRELNGVHTCDKRRTLSYIRQTFPFVDVEPGFEEEDIYWKKDERETHAEVEVRVRRVLDKVFNEDEEDEYISITAHSGWIARFLHVVGHKPYDLPTGGVVPVVIKGTRV